MNVKANSDMNKVTLKYFNNESLFVCEIVNIKVYYFAFISLDQFAFNIDHPRNQDRLFFFD